MIDGKRGGEWCTALHPERTTAARLRTVGGYKGGGEKAGAEGRHDEAKKFGVAYWCRCGSSRVRIYILLLAIYYIFIYIYYLYIYNINIISIYLIVYINIIPFSPFSCNTSVLYVKNSIYRACK